MPLNPNGTISEAAGVYVGMDRFACRKQIIKDLARARFSCKN
jgi:valyl-tRNA synthetase